jgi:hypothetical protein
MAKGVGFPFWANTYPCLVHIFYLAKKKKGNNNLLRHICPKTEKYLNFQHFYIEMKGHMFEVFYEYLNWSCLNSHLYLKKKQKQKGRGSYIPHSV